MNGKFIVTLMVSFLLLQGIGEVSGQQKQNIITIKSVVKDENGNPIPNVDIYGKEGANRVQSDINGGFTINVTTGSKLLIESEGYNKTILSTSNFPETIILSKSSYLMGEDDVVNIAFGKIKKNESIGSFSVLNTNKILKADNEQDVTNAIKGNVLGLMNNPILRGKGEPLVVVNGIARSLASVIMEEVEQITVLKDANASLLYGSQAKNGVILITTKKGLPFKRKINFSLEQGFSTPIALPNYLGSADYMKLYNEALTNDGLSPAYSEDIISKYASGENIYRYPNTNYYSNEFLKSSKPITTFISEFSGGNETTQYYANFGWVSSGSLYKLGEGQNANVNRLNARANVDIKINDYIKSNIDAVVVFDIDKDVNGNFWEYSSTLHPNFFSPLIPISMIEDKESIEAAKLIEGKYILGGTSQYMNNVYGNMYQGGYNQNIKRTVQINNGIDVDLRKITKGLTFKTYFSFDLYNSFSQSVVNKYAVYNPTWDTDNQDKITGLKKFNEDEAKGVQTLSNADYTRNVGAYATFNYDRTFNTKHNITGTLLGYFNSTHLSYVVVDDKHAHLGLRGTYNYDKKYFVDLSTAYVHSVKFANGNRNALSPSIGLAWVMSEEDFIKNNDFIDYLKLKVSAGIINTDVDINNQSNPDHYMYQSTFLTNGKYKWGDGQREGSAVIVNRYNNQNLTFEKVEDVNFGIEGSFFDNMLSVDANAFYSKNSGKVIQRVTYPAYLSTYIPFENFNADSYTGAELGLNLNKKMGDFSFNIGANLLYTVSNVDKKDEIWQSDYQYRQGRSVYSIFGLESIGFFNDDADIQNSPTQMFGTVRPGDIKYKDQNNDEIIDQNDEIEIGDFLPDFSYGIHLNFKYKNLNIFVLGNGQNGSNDIYNNDYFWVDGNDKYSDIVLNRWTPETSQSATYPRLSSKSNANNYRNSTFWIYNNNFFSINRIQLTYDLPKVIIPKIGIKDLSIYVRGSNLFMLTKDAEQKQIKIGEEPMYRSFSGGLKVIF